MFLLPSIAQKKVKSTVKSSMFFGLVLPVDEPSSEKKVAKVEKVSSHELSLLLGSAPAMVTTTRPWTIAGLYFADKVIEHDFSLQSARDYMDRRLPHITFMAFGLLVFIFSVALFQSLTIVEELLIASIAIIIIVTGAVATKRPIFTTQPHLVIHCRLVVELMVVTAIPLVLILVKTRHVATVSAIALLFVTIIVIHPSRIFAMANLVAVIASYAAVCSLSSDSSYDMSTEVTEVLLFAAMVIIFIFFWVVENFAVRSVFLNARTLNETWQATQRVLISALPSHVVPTLIDQICERRDWGSLATAESDVTIIFVRFPALSHDVFPPSPAAAVAHLNSLWTLCESITNSFGISSLEVTNTEFVGVMGLGTICSKKNVSNAAVATRAGLAIIAALPPAFAAVVRVGVHCGPVIAGFVGTLRPRYTFVGDTMNTASRMASAASPGRMTVSANVMGRITGLFDATQRTITVKGKGVATVSDIIAGSDARRSRSQSISRRLSAPGNLGRGGASEHCASTGTEGGRRRTISTSERQVPAHDHGHGHGHGHAHASTSVSLTISSQPVVHICSSSFLSGELECKGHHTYAHPSTLSSRFTAQPFSFFFGFRSKEMEARYHAHTKMPVSPFHTRCITLLMAVTLSFQLAMNNFDDVRFWLNIALAILGGTLMLATLILPDSAVMSSHILKMTVSCYICSIFLSPFFAQNSNVWMSIIYTFCRVDFFTDVQRIAIFIAHATLITVLDYVKYYEFGPQMYKDDVILCVWVMLFFTVIRNLNVSFMLRMRFAHAQVLAAAQDAGAVALKHLLPRSLFETLAAGNELSALRATENEDVAVLVADIVGFTAMSAMAASPAIVFDLVNGAFREFERVAHAEGAFKVKTIGDCIVFAAGLRDFPGPAANRATRVALLTRVARAMHAAAAHLQLRVRIGIHVGSLVSGVMNSRGFVYDIWGEGIRNAMAAEAAAPLGGTAFTAEAAAVVEREIALVLKSGEVTDVGGHDSLTPRFFTMFDREISLSILIPPQSSERVAKATLPGSPSRSPLSSTPPSSLATIVEIRSSSILRNDLDHNLDHNNDDSNSNKEGPLTWAWDVFRGNDDESRLPSVALELLRPALACGLIPETAARAITIAMCASYDSRVPFHNAYHGVATMQVSLLIAASLPTARALLTDFDILVIALAALGHDAGHVGFNNAFEIAARSPIALSHGVDGPVLERFHAASTIKMLVDTNVFALLSSSARAGALHLVTTAIMATDMSQHIDIMNDLERCGTLDKLPLSAICGAFVHCADLSCHTSTTALSLLWTNRLATEFSIQAAAEETRGLPVTHFMTGLDKPLTRSRMQANFLARIIVPLWRALAFHADGMLDDPLRNLERNSNFYETEAQRLHVIAVKGAGRFEF